MTLRREDLVEELRRRREAHCFPARLRSHARDIAERTLALLFPHFSDDLDCAAAEIEIELLKLEKSLRHWREAMQNLYPVPAIASIESFLANLPSLEQSLILDARAIHEGDPAARSVDEVILAYPGFLAIAVHRIAHALHGLGYPLLPRLLAEHAHRRTGVDIHPAATIGRGFFIDHGTGLVIGETAVIGNGVKLYQGVTLGALVVQKDLAQRKRHPTLEDNVVVYANATILGGETMIGHDSIVGGNAWVTSSVPPFSAVGRNAEARPRRANAADDIEFNI